MPGTQKQPSEPQTLVQVDTKEAGQKEAEIPENQLSEEIAE